MINTPFWRSGSRGLDALGNFHAAVIIIRKCHHSSSAMTVRHLTHNNIFGIDTAPGVTFNELARCSICSEDAVCSSGFC